MDAAAAIESAIVSCLRIETFPDAALTPPLPVADGLPSRAVRVASRDPTVMYAMHRPDVNLVIPHCDLPKILRGARLRPLLDAAPFTAVVQGRPEELADRLADCLPVPAPFDLLLDFSELVLVFSMLDRRHAHVRLRLEALTHDGCKKWHADHIGLRLLCTYHGPGTEWLSLDGGAAAARALGRDVPHGLAMRMPTTAVAILKGETYPSNVNR